MTSTNTTARMSTHRVIQLSQLLDTVQAKASQYRRGAAKLASIGNRLGAIVYVRKAQKCDSIAWRVRTRLFDVESQNVI